ncbi:MAG: DUF3040 domain-containing protein [Aeromicrobium erythreum]
MPLSDEEARLLQQLEQSLAAEDPELASTLRGSKQAARNRRIAIVSSLGLVAGIAVMFVGALNAQTVVGVLGFLMMLVSAYFLVTAWRGGLTGADDAPKGRGPKPKGKGKGASGGSFVDRMEERWQRRQQGDDL